MIAITGAAGFIGSNLAEHLYGLGHHRLLLVDQPLTRLKAANFAGLPSIRFIESLAFLDWLEDDDSTLEAIFHLGRAATRRSKTGLLWRNNVEYSQRLWQWCTHRGVPLDLCLGRRDLWRWVRSGFDDETTPGGLRPLNLYGKSKNEFDRSVLDRLEAGGRRTEGVGGTEVLRRGGPEGEPQGADGEHGLARLPSDRRPGQSRPVQVDRSEDPRRRTASRFRLHRRLHLST